MVGIPYRQAVDVEDTRIHRSPSKGPVPFVEVHGILSPQGGNVRVADASEVLGHFLPDPRDLGEVVVHDGSPIV